jgi:NAD(P)-dependent dehydrogenase (short-subunit alcohol dehydrogenase family)
MKPSRPTSLITGASAGIGAAFARELASRGHDLVLTARRADRLEALATELRDRCSCAVTVLPCDLADPATPQKLLADLDERGLKIDWLINNAGYGVPGALVDSAWSTHADSLAAGNARSRLWPHYQRGVAGRLSSRHIWPHALRRDQVLFDQVFAVPGAREQDRRGQRLRAVSGFYPFGIPRRHRHAREDE